MKTLKNLKLTGSGLPNAIRFLSSQTDIIDLPHIFSDNPVFLLSAGWRTGSTLLQRLICSKSNILLWGEPFGDIAPVHYLAKTVELLSEGTPYLNQSIGQFNGELATNWIANLHPGIGALRASHLSYFERLFATIAHQKGFARWGCKWVRITGYHAHYLKWLYPQAKFLFLVRHPLESYQSYKGKSWYLIRNDIRMINFMQFFEHWKLLAESFLSEVENLDGMIVRYEDIISKSEAINQIEKYLEINIDHTLLKRKIGSSNKNRLKSLFLIRVILALRSKKIFRKLGYSTSGGLLEYSP